MRFGINRIKAYVRLMCIKRVINETYIEQCSDLLSRLEALEDFIKIHGDREKVGCNYCRNRNAYEEYKTEYLQRIINILEEELKPLQKRNEFFNIGA